MVLLKSKIQRVFTFKSKIVRTHTFKSALIRTFLFKSKLDHGITVSPPTAPSSLVALAVSSSQINLMWTDNSDNEDSFRVEQSPDGVGSWVEVVSLAPDTTSYNVTGLSGNTTYYFRIRAVNDGGSTYSNIANDTTLSDLPAAPTLLTATTFDDDRIDLAWTDNSDNETGFEIERSLTGVGGWSLIHTTAADVESYSDTGLDPETEYFYRVRAVNGAGESAYTNIDSATTDPDLTDGLIGHWTGDDSSLVDSIAANNFTALNGATFGEGKGGDLDSAFSLDGVNDGFSAPNHFSNTVGSISLWVKQNQSGVYVGFATQANSGVNNRYWGFGQEGITNKPFVQWNNGSGTIRLIGVTSINDDNWHHLVIMSNGSTTTMYVDNSPETLNEDLGLNDGFWLGDISSPAANNFAIGFLNRLSVTWYYGGLIDDVRVYNKVLSASERTALFNLTLK